MFEFRAKDGVVDVTCPWGNHIRCHGPDFLPGKQWDADQWNAAIDLMLSTAPNSNPPGRISEASVPGLIPPHDRQVLVDYLVKNFGPDSTPRGLAVVHRRLLGRDSRPLVFVSLGRLGVRLGGGILELLGRHEMGIYDADVSELQNLRDACAGLSWIFSVRGGVLLRVRFCGGHSRLAEPGALKAQARAASSCSKA